MPEACLDCFWVGAGRLPPRGQSDGRRTMPPGPGRRRQASAAGSCSGLPEFASFFPAGVALQPGGRWQELRPFLPLEIVSVRAPPASGSTMPVSGATSISGISASSCGGYISASSCGAGCTTATSTAAGGNTISGFFHVLLDMLLGLVVRDVTAQAAGSPARLAAGGAGRNGGQQPETAARLRRGEGVLPAWRWRGPAPRLDASALAFERRSAHARNTRRRAFQPGIRRGQAAGAGFRARSYRQAAPPGLAVARTAAVGRRVSGCRDQAPPSTRSCWGKLLVEFDTVEGRPRRTLRAS